jgi:hypothetical protein
MSGDVQGGLPKLRSSCSPPAAPASSRRLHHRHRQRQRSAVATLRTLYPAPGQSSNLHSARETGTLGLSQYASPEQPSTSSHSTSQSSQSLSTPSSFPGHRNERPAPCPTAAPTVNSLEISYAKDPVDFPGARSERLASYPPASQLFENISSNGPASDAPWAAVTAADRFLSGVHYTVPMPDDPTTQFPSAITCAEEPVLLSQADCHAGSAPFDFLLDFQHQQSWLVPQLYSARPPSAAIPLFPLSNPGPQRLQTHARIGGFTSKGERHRSRYPAGTCVSRGDVESDGPLGHSAMTTYMPPVTLSIAESPHHFHTSFISPPKPKVR